MKTALMRIRIAEEDKSRIEAFANRSEKSISEIMRQAAASAITGEVPGERERRACAAVRRSANQVLALLEAGPVDIDLFRVAVSGLRAAAREVVQCQ